MNVPLFTLSLLLISIQLLKDALKSKHLKMNIKKFIINGSIVIWNLHGRWPLERRMVRRKRKSSLQAKDEANVQVAQP